MPQTTTNTDSHKLSGIPIFTSFGSGIKTTSKVNLLRYPLYQGTIQFSNYRIIQQKNA